VSQAANGNVKETHETRAYGFVNLRISAELSHWLYEFVKLASRGHAPKCLCPACRMRRELE
jgi:hypothetical protein